MYFKRWTLLLLVFVVSTSNGSDCNCPGILELVQELQSRVQQHADILTQVPTYQRETDKLSKILKKFQDDPSEDAETLETVNGKIKSETTKMAEALRSDISGNVSEQIQLELENKINNLLEHQINETEKLRTAFQVSLKQLQIETEFIRNTFNQQMKDVSSQLKAQRSIENQTSLLFRNITQDLTQLRFSSENFNQSLLELDQRMGLMETRLFDAFDEFLRTNAMEKFWNDDDATLPHKYNSLSEIIRRFFVAFGDLDKKLSSLKDAKPTIHKADEDLMI